MSNAIRPLPTVKPPFRSLAQLAADAPQEYDRVCREFDRERPEAWRRPPTDAEIAAIARSKPSVAAPKVAPSKRLTAYTRHQGSDRPYANFYLAMCAAGDALERAKTAHVSDCDCDFCRELFGVGVLVELSDSILCAV